MFKMSWSRQLSLLHTVTNNNKSRCPIKPNNNDPKDKRDKPLGTTPDAGNKNDNAV